MPKNKQGAKYHLTAMINRTTKRQAAKEMISRTQSICHRYSSLTSDFVFSSSLWLKFLPTSEGKKWCSNLEECWKFIYHLYTYKILKNMYCFCERVPYTSIPHPIWLLHTYTIVDFSINRVYTIPLNSQSCQVLQRCLVAIADYQKWSNAIEKKPLQNKTP